jgi:hypothetical protein
MTEYLAEYIRWNLQYVVGVKEITELEIMNTELRHYSLTFEDVLRLQSLHIPSRHLSQPADLIRAVSIVDTDTIDSDVTRRSRRLLVM